MKKVSLALSLVFIPILAVEAVPTLATTTYSVSDLGSRDIIGEIIDVVGLKPRFEVRTANIENAAAVIYNGKRYILYNERFLAAINSAVHTDWASVSILAHEIGHHLNGHTLSRAGSNHPDELEADEFSGFVLRKMGASLDEAQAAMKLLSDERSSPTHPGRAYRLAAISRGWGNADTQLMASIHGQQRESQPMAGSSQAAQRVPATVKLEPRAASSGMDSRLVLRKVIFNNAPSEQFFLTTRLQLVHLTEDGARVIGTLARTNSRDYPFYFESDYLQGLFVTDSGILVNKRGQQVGYFG
ncbi:membrane-binding protein [Pontibacter sp. JH31]|uniref:Membrane-binding protein n=1 Tax=Pontibacter aquaedesilientis TaxID=2766980 RepID=A0ABR7XD95_9BACT|nr:membrane-binding protein [Pontibacter aquaedesilientis]